MGLCTNLSNSAGSILSVLKHAHISLILKHETDKSPQTKGSQTTMPFPTSVHPQTHFHTSISEVCIRHSSPPVYFSLPHYVPLPPVPDRDLLMKVTFQLPSPTVMFCYYVISVSVALAAVDSSLLPYTLRSVGFLPSLLFFLPFILVSYVSIFPYS